VGRLTLLLLPLTLPLAALTSGCGDEAGAGSGSGVNVVATTTQVGDLVRNVGGERVDLHQILQPNTDPHEYEPRPSDVQATSGAKVVFESGQGLDQWMAKVVSAAGAHPKVIVLSAELPVELGKDPHWWHDPRNAEAAVATISDELSHAVPKSSATFRRNAESYLTRLRGLDRGIAACFSRVPRSERKLVTDHDAFGYFAHRYGITVVGAVIPSLTTHAQPSAGDTARLIRLVRREHVRAIFPESSMNPRLAETVARATGASSNYRLYGDTLGPKGSRGASYVTMESANADALVRGFTGGSQRCTIL
jgi:zinc/manganese transport system substrate-binding protein